MSCRWLAVVLVSVGLGVGGCSRHDTHIEPGDKSGLLARIAVLPFRTDGMLDTSGSVGAAPEGVPPVPASAGQHAAVVLAGAFRDMGLSVVEQSVVERAIEARQQKSIDVEAASELGEQLAATLVVFGVLTRYEDRKGSALGVERPATVWYQVALVRTEDGKLLGRDQFDYTQKPPSANILELGRVVEEGGFGWQTSQQILDAALARTATRLVRGLTRGRPAVAATGG